MHADFGALEADLGALEDFGLGPHIHMCSAVGCFAVQLRFVSVVLGRRLPLAAFRRACARAELPHSAGVVMRARLPRSVGVGAWAHLPQSAGVLVGAGRLTPGLNGDCVCRYDRGWAGARV